MKQHKQNVQHHKSTYEVYTMNLMLYTRLTLHHTRLCSPTPTPHTLQLKPVVPVQLQVTTARQ